MVLGAEFFLRLKYGKPFRRQTANFTSVEGNKEGVVSESSLDVDVLKANARVPLNKRMKLFIGGATFSCILLFIR